MTTVRGFTLVELLITLAIATIVLMMGVPGFQAVVESNRITSNTNTAVTALKYARSEAMNQSRELRVEPLSEDGCRDGETGLDISGDADWSGGFQVVNADDEDDVLREFPAFGNATVACGPDAVAFSRRGRTTAGSGEEVRLGPVDKAADETRNLRCISVLTSGITRLLKEDGC